MRGAAISAGLLLATLAIALGFLPRRIAAAGVAVAAIAALAIALAAEPAADLDAIYAGCWLSLIVAALSVYWPGPARRWPWLPVAFAVNAGAWAGIVMASESGAARPPWALLALLLVVPAWALVQRRWTIPPRVATSWLLAVALLVGAIPHLVAHPGYVRDHME